MKPGEDLYTRTPGDAEDYEAHRRGRPSEPVSPRPDNPWSSERTLEEQYSPYEDVGE